MGLLVSGVHRTIGNVLAGVTGGKTVARDVPCFSARLWIASTRWLFTAVWWLSCEQYGVVWHMMVALLDVSGSLDGSVAGCERVLDVSVSWMSTLWWW